MSDGAEVAVSEIQNVPLGVDEFRGKAGVGTKGLSSEKVLLGMEDF
jgi:hypothetical protein